jgi:flagellar protein FliO/FliZ
MDSAMLVLRVLLALACVVGLIWYVARRFGGGQVQRTSREHEVRLVGRQSVGRHTGVAVVAVGQRRLLVGYGDQQVTLLTELGLVVDAEVPPVAPVTAPRLPWPTAARSTTDHVPDPRPAPDDETAAQPLQGSILSPETWRQAVRTLQDRTVRR